MKNMPTRRHWPLLVVLLLYLLIDSISLPESWIVSNIRKQRRSRHEVLEAIWIAVRRCPKYGLSEPIVCSNIGVWLCNKHRHKTLKCMSRGLQMLLAERRGFDDKLSAIEGINVYVNDFSYGHDLSRPRVQFPLQAGPAPLWPNIPLCKFPSSSAIGYPAPRCLPWFQSRPRKRSHFHSPV